MSLGLEQSEDFREDFALQALWYVREAGEEIALDFQKAVDDFLRNSADNLALLYAGEGLP